MSHQLLNSALIAATCAMAPAFGGFFSRSSLITDAEVAGVKKQEAAPVPVEDASNQGHERDQGKMMPGYNAPARYNQVGKWDFFLRADFIYWRPRQDGMELGITVPDHGGAIPATPNVGGRVVNFDSDYKPGFRVGAGMSFPNDSSTISLLYTRLHGKHKTSQDAPTGGVIGDVWSSGTGAFTTASTVSGNWDLKLDFLDGVASRRYYVGKCLTVEPTVGLRAAWINQEYAVHYHSATVLDSEQRIHNHSDSWGLGPIFGVDASWLMGSGFRIFGKASGSALYTHYRVHLSENSSTAPTTDFINVRNTVSQLRPMIETALGLGWGRYFFNNKLHFDLMVAYDFNIYWDQNMMRQLKDLQDLGSGANPGNLSVNGLTVSARFDF